MVTSECKKGQDDGSGSPVPPAVPGTRVYHMLLLLGILSFFPFSLKLESAEVMKYNERSPAG